MTFQIGDYVVSTEEGKEPWKWKLCTVTGQHKDMVMSLSDNGIIHHYKLRHATPEEIKTGKRI